MKKRTVIIIDLCIVLLIATATYFYLNRKNIITDRTEHDYLLCGHRKSYDCTVKDGTTVSGTLKLSWQKFPIQINQLPPDSWYKITSNTSDNYELLLYPNVGKHYLLGKHDFTISLKINPGARDQKIPLTCSTGADFKKSTDIPGGIISNGPYDIELGTHVNYFYNGPAGGNPNPYTYEVINILKKISENIKLGKCI
jgi:hypothetical protein